MDPAIWDPPVMDPGTRDPPNREPGDMGPPHTLQVKLCQDLETCGSFSFFFQLGGAPSRTGSWRRGLAQGGVASSP